MCAWFDTFIGNNRMLKWVSRFDKRVSLLMHISRLPARIIYLINDRKIQFAKLIREYTPSPLLSLFFLPSLSFSLSFPDSHRHPRFICLDSSSSSSRCEHSNLSKLIWQRSLSRTSCEGEIHHEEEKGRSSPSSSARSAANILLFSCTLS